MNSILEEEQKPRPRPQLQEVPLESVLPFRVEVYITMSRGQWDGVLEGFYVTGAILLEVDDEGRFVRAFRRTVQ